MDASVAAVAPRQEAATRANIPSQCPSSGLPRKRAHDGNDDEAAPNGPKRRMTDAGSLHDSTSHHKTSRTSARSSRAQPTALHTPMRDMATCEREAHDVLPFVPIHYVDARDSAGINQRRRPYRSNFSRLLKDPGGLGRYDGHQLLPAEFDYKAFLEPLPEWLHDFEETTSIYHVQLTKRSNVAGEGFICHDGEFVDAILPMLCSLGKSRSNAHVALDCRITVTVQDGDPMNGAYEPFQLCEDLRLASVVHHEDSTTDTQHEPETASNAHGRISTSPEDISMVDANPAAEGQHFPIDEHDDEVSTLPKDNDAITTNTTSQQPPCEEPDATAPASSRLPDSSTSTSHPVGPDQEEEDESDLDSNESSSGDEDDVDGEYDEEVDELGSRVADLLRSRLDAANWAAACQYFHHNPNLTSNKPEDGLRLTGTNQPLLPFQVTDVYIYFQLVTSRDAEKRRYGALLGHEMGLGKTRLVMAIAAVRQFCFSLWEHASDPLNAHLHKTKDHDCFLIRRAGDPECPCDINSMSYDVVHETHRGGTLAIVPAGLVMQTFEKASEFFSRRFSVQFPDHRARFKGTVVTTWDQEKKGPDFSDTMQLGCGEWTFRRGEPFLDSERPRPEPTEFTGNSQALFAELGITASIEPPEHVDHRLPCTLFMVVSRSMLQKPGSFDDVWATEEDVLVADNTWYRVLLSAGYCFGFLILDEIHDWRSLDASQVQCVFRILQRQQKKPLIAALSGTPVSSSLTDLTFTFSLLKGLYKPDDINDVKVGLKELNDIMGSDNMTEDESAQVSNGLIGFIQRTADSTFLKKPLMRKPKAVLIDVECPIGEKYKEALSRLTKRVQEATVAEMQLQLKNTRKPSRKAVRNAIYKRPDVCHLALAIQFPGLAQSIEVAEAEGESLPINWDLISPYACPVKTPEPRQYDGCFPEEWDEFVDVTLDELPRGDKIVEITEEAYSDDRLYDEPGLPSFGFNGPKNVLILAERPFAAQRLKLFVERTLDPEKFESTWIHGGMSKPEKANAIEWFASFRDNNGNFQTKTRILISTYKLCSTGLDGLKAACYMILFTVIRRYSTLAQATARVDRLGQLLPPYIYTFQSSEHPFEEMTMILRDKRARLFGRQGILGQIAGWNY
ncbi:hypothetical protein CGCSCA4_v014762 [Colletotrichum siamense]|uniref:Helicase ATP-binding domain-containing protein n=1 Tax=Colletotrichum siamense TaxID=690259 RepID=A0A9P5BMK3_COLSI|nr:hypothetical protein CGCSCA4_v014762 [Colletotrichum siamense]KAF4845064.1 hypothetical protein CGCSCA2_v013772 [Colletotrichum siamense]